MADDIILTFPDDLFDGNVSVTLNEFGVMFAEDESKVTITTPNAKKLRDWLNMVLE